MFLMDTDHISILQQESGTEFARLLPRMVRHGPTNLALPVVSFHEQSLGCNDYIKKSRSPIEVVRGYGMFDRTIKAFSTKRVLSFDVAAAAVCDELISRRLRINTMDLRIAAIALSRDLT